MSDDTKPRPLECVCSDLERALTRLEAAHGKARDSSRANTEARNEVCQVNKEVEQLQAEIADLVKQRSK
jgi:hypothetical protein